MWRRKKFNYVTFSHHTAKINPYMIINEYKRIIEQKEDELRPFYNK